MSWPHEYHFKKKQRDTMKEIRICLKQSRCEHTDRMSDAVSQSAIKKKKKKKKQMKTGSQVWK